MLEIKNLKITIDGITVVKDSSFTAKSGKITAIVGESGSGKTMTALAVTKLLPYNARCEGQILLDNKSLMEMENDYKVSMIFQEPMTSLNPLMKVGKQIDEVLLLHTKLNDSERKERVLAMMKKVELPKAEELYNRYPHELSGGMRQRVMIAMAMINNPQVLIADEPTTALDPVVQSQIIELIKRINYDYKTTILFISHDLNLVRSLADNIIVMNEGEIVEQGDPDEIFNHPTQEYTQKLINALPKGKKIHGMQDENILVSIEDVALYYNENHKKNFFVENIDFNVCKGEIVGLVGRSGCGKTSLCRAILRLNKYYTGRITNRAAGSTMIFQDPLSSLNPAKKVSWILEEPLRVQRKYSSNERKERVKEMLYRVGLSDEYMDRYPSELSGGQRQRISIASALIGGADFVVADEAVSALDVTVQAQILDLLVKLQKDMGLTILFISHDMKVVEKICDRIIEI